MRALVIVLAVVGLWLALLPPFFTHGACDAEFAEATALLERARPQLLTFSAARSFLAASGLPFQVLSAQTCEDAPPREVEVCAGGPALLSGVPVKNRVCRLYRDDRTHLQLGFNESGQLVRIETDMKPAHFLKVPFTEVRLDWAR